MTDTTTRKPSASERRLAAINVLAESVRHATVRDDGPHVHWTERFEDRAAVATAIRALAQHGRTDRWQAAVEGWAYAVETAETDAEYRHAFDQHGIWAAYAAE